MESNKPKRKQTRMTTEEIERCRALVLALWSEGLSIDEIAPEIRRRLGHCRFQSAHVAAYLSRELRQIEARDREAIRRWERSKRYSPGDIEAMEVRLQCIDERCRLLRLYP